MSGVRPAGGPLGRWTRARMGLSAALLLGLLGVVVWRGYTLQVAEGARLREMARQQYLRQVELPPRRGTIHDRHGAPLAVSVEVDSVFANPRVVGSRAAAVAMQLGDVLGIEQRELRRKLSGRRYFVWLKRRVSPREAEQVRALDIKGISLTKEPRRFYPNSGLGGTVVGFSGVDGRGLEGLELSLEKWLRGSPRRVSGLRDALGRSLMTDSVRDAPVSGGHNVHLALDRFVQYETEQALAEAAEEVSDKRGWASAVVMDPLTGDVLAMASAPTFDPNRYSDTKAAHRRNRTITDAFEPGSTLKVFSVGAALDLGLVGPTEVLDCENGRWRLGRYTLHDSHAYKWLSVTDVLVKSSNICSAKLGFRLGKRRLYDRLRRYGFGERTGIPLRGERAGVLREPSKWSDVGLANIAFGQGMTVTVLQLARALTALGNRGKLMEPRLITRITDHAGQVVEAYAPRGEQVMRSDTAALLLRMLAGVTEKGGTGVDAALDRYTVAGKTGTAQKVDPETRTYGDDLWVSSFVGLVPATRPRLVIAVVVNEPVGEKYYGGEVAGPVFRRIAERSLSYLGVKPDRASSATKNRKRSAGGAGDAGGKTAAVAEDPAVIQVVPPPLPGGERPTGSLQVPNFTGMSMAEAIEAARKAGLTLRPVGSGRAVAQDPGPGPTPAGTACKVLFKPPGG